MTPTAIEPLDPGTWFRRVEMLMNAAEKLDGESPDTLIRSAFHLVVLAPGPLRELFPANIDEAAFEAMLDCGGYESAVMSLIGTRVAFKAEKKLRSNIIEVSISLDPHSIYGTGRHHTCAVAMIRAGAQCLVNFAKTARVLNQTDLTPHKFPGELLRNSTEH